MLSALFLAALVAASRAAPPGVPPASLTPPAGPAPIPAALRLSWDQPNHPSAIYHVKDEASLTILIDNPGRASAELSGEIVFGMRTPAATTTNATASAPAAADLKILAVIPIATADIGPGQRAKIPLNLTFGAAGSYELRWRHADTTDPIAGTIRDMSLECIFAPRSATPGSAPASPAAMAEESPWITRLPPPAVRRPGYLSDYAAQTTIRRFLIDERFSFDGARNVGLGFGASTGASVREIDALLAEAARCKASFTLRVTVPIATPLMQNDKSVAAFAAYITDAIKRSQGTLDALAILPAADTANPTEAQRHTFEYYYLAAYEAARKADKSVALLGAGSAQLSAVWLADRRLAVYIDALAIADAVEEPAMAVQFLAGGGPKKKPLCFLPPLPGQPWSPPAAALASGAAQVALPSPEADHGVAAHLLGGTVFVQRLHITVPTADRTAPDSSNIPFIAVFQGDGYSIAAVAGFSAGTELDTLYPDLARTRTEVSPVKPDENPTYPNLQVGDDSHAMRVVDDAGAPVDCRIGDNLFIPAADTIVYLLQAGSAQDLAGSLRVANANRLPLFEPLLRASAEGLTIQLHNVTTRPLAGTLRLIRPSREAGQASELIAEADFDAIPADKTHAVALLTKEAPPPTAQLVVEIVTTGSKSLLQRTAVMVQRTPAN